MQLDSVIGNDSVRKALASMVSLGRVPHAMLFYENDGGGALKIVLAFLEDLFGGGGRVSRLIHPDVHFIFPVASGKVSEKVETLTSERYLPYWRELVTSNPYFCEHDLEAALGIEGKASGINVADAKFILESLSLTAVEGGWKAVVVYLPEKMNASAANRLLKIVEEPPEMTLFLMVTHAPERVMPTISSRCQGIRVLPLSRDEVARVLENEFSFSSEEAEEGASLSGGSVGAALDYLSEKGGYEARLDLFADLMEALMSKDLLAALEVGETLAALPSRENQKAFCKFAGEMLRKVFVEQQSLAGLSAVSERDGEFVRKIAAGTRKTFPRNALAAFDRAEQFLERNVNQKLLFCDLVNRLYLMV